MRRLTHIAITAAMLLTTAPTVSADDGVYRNPVIDQSLPDPTIVRTQSGDFYLYATENTRNVPIYHSRNLVDWTFVGTAFTDTTRPQWNSEARIWAPDINFVEGRYVLYYAKSTWGGEWECGIGVATADRPEGPFTDHGPLFISRELGTQNAIDPDYVEDDGHKYLFWGSFHGIWYIELSADGLRLKDGAKPALVAGTFMEATYIHRHGAYYYIFGSAGTCCDGERSTYHVTVGRSERLLGPYVDRQGRPLMENHYETVLRRSDRCIGPGHNAEIFTDDDGTDWIAYHGFKTDTPEDGRVVWLDRIVWIDGWPHIADGKPSDISKRPRFAL